MATRTEMVAELMEEFGKDSPSARTAISRVVGAVTKDLLSQNDGRFSGLSRTQTLEFASGATQKKVDKDFNTASKTCLIVNSDGNYVDEFYVVSETEFYRRQANSSEYPGAYYGRIERLRSGAEGDGNYLILGAAPESTYYIKLFFYRKPTPDDTNLIKNEEIVRTGARGRLRQFNADYELDLKIYFLMRGGFKESPESKTTKLIMRPSKRTEKYNREMHIIGEGG